MSTATIFCSDCGTGNHAHAKFCYACGKMLLLAPASNAQTGLLHSSHLLKQRYLIIKTLGKGGFGAVYQVEDTLFSPAQRALKEMGLSNYFNAQEVQQATDAFKDEALLLASLSHPNLPRIYDHFAENGRWYLVMDYLEGETLEAQVERMPAKRLAIDKVITMGIELCNVLHYLHTRPTPIIFRDLKPANVMVTTNHQLYLIDFGIARLFKPGQTKDTAILGTPGYAAPEQYGRAQTTPRSDIYSLGATLHYLATGYDPSQTPFFFPPIDITPTTPTIQAFNTLLTQMLAMKPEARPSNILAVKRSLEELQQPAQPAAIVEAPPVVVPIPQQPVITDFALGIIVDQQGKGHFTTIDEALTHAQPKQRIYVRPGIYTDSLVLDKDVEIIGDGPRDQVIIDCADQHSLQLHTSNATIRGLTITNHNSQSNNVFISAIDITKGKPHLEECSISSKAGCGITIHGLAAQPVIRKCTILEARKSGIFVYDKGQGHIQDCNIYGHQEDGVVIANAATPLFKQCKIFRNFISGIFCHEQGRGLFEDCNITENSYANVRSTTHSNPTLRRCRIHAGKQHGLVFNDQGLGTIEQCDIFANCTAQVQISMESHPTLRGCKIHDGKQNGISIINGGRGKYVDCDIYANTNAGISIAQKSHPEFQRCRIYNGQANGIFILEQGQGLFENCDIFQNNNTGISIVDGSTPTFRRCQIHHGKQNGVFVYDQGAGTFSYCDIFANAYSGVAISKRGNPHVQHCKIYANQASGVFIYSGGAGRIEQCDFRENQNEALSISVGCVVQLKDNDIHQY